MHYLIDGHNVIGQSRTIRLHDPDDEQQLLSALHRWLLRTGKHRITVVFDGGTYHAHRAPSFPGVEAIFARSPQDADERLKRLITRIAEPKRYRLVTSDRAIIAVAQPRGIEIVNAATFAAQLDQPDRPSRSPGKLAKPRPEPKLSRAEVDRWLAEFGVIEPPESNDTSV